MTLQLQRHFSNNITTLCRRLLIDVFFATLLQRRDMVERRRELKTTTLQRRHDVVCQLGISACGHYFVQTGLYKSVFYIYSFGKLLLHFPEFSVCFVF